MHFHNFYSLFLATHQTSTLKSSLSQYRQDGKLRPIAEEFPCKGNPLIFSFYGRNANCSWKSHRKMLRNKSKSEAQIADSGILTAFPQVGEEQRVLQVSFYYFPFSSEKFADNFPVATRLSTSAASRARPITTPESASSPRPRTSTMLPSTAWLSASPTRTSSARS